MEIEGKGFVVAGLGKTGIETSRFLLERGADVYATDSAPRDSLSAEVDALEASGAVIETGGHDPAAFLGADSVVLSPGVPLAVPAVARAIEAGVTVMSEVELASRFLRAPIIAVTGSNGKTTTATLINSILEASGKKTFLGGNIGTPLITIAGRDGGLDYIVAELSSFQLQGTSTIKPHIAILLNISPNHLDHHADLAEYVASKMKIFANQTPGDHAVYNSSDPEVLSALGALGPLAAHTVPFGGPGDPTGDATGGVEARGTLITFRAESYELAGMRLRGAHNVENAMAAIAAGALCGCPVDIVEDTIRSFEPLPHRIEPVREVCGATFINDSKSTSPAATLRALESFAGPVILIAGGKDKGASFGLLRGAVAGKVKLLIAVGESAGRIRSELAGAVETVEAASLEEGVSMAFGSLAGGDTVLFSPGCSSFDMFGSYIERGRRFKSIVQDFRV